MKKLTDAQMEEICNEKENYQPIDDEGNLCLNFSNVRYIVDSQDVEKDSETEEGARMCVITDKGGDYGYYIEIKKWW